MLRFTALVFLSLLLGSCASYFKRKECEQKNWYEYSKNLALKGQRLSEDTLYQQCQKAEAEIDESQADLGFKAGRDEYCTEDGAFRTGRKGLVLKLDLCGENSRAIQAKYKEGIKRFCEEDAAYDFGSKGGEYQSTCPPELEPTFLVGFKKGRRVFVMGEIERLEGSYGEHRRRHSLVNQRLPNQRRVVARLERQRSVRQNAGKDTTGLDSRLSSERSDLWQLEREVQDVESKMEEDMKAIGTFRAELKQLLY